VDTPQRRYYKRLELPVEVDEKTATSRYKNGILETVLEKKERKGEGTPVRIN